MKGWVYVITNKAMPGLVKVGFSTKDPELRAKELQHTGSPHPYLVEYELLIEEPYEVEQKTHRLLSSNHEAKEWFRCTPEEAVAAIKQIAGNRVITETYKRVERARADALFQQQLQEKEAQRKQKQAEQEIENRIRTEESAIRQKYEKQFEATFPPRPFWNYWIGASSVSFIGISMLTPKSPEPGAFILAALLGAILGAFLQSFLENRLKQSNPYLTLEEQRDKELAAARATIVSDGVTKYDLKNPLDHLPVELRETVRATLKRFLEDEKEIARCTEKIKSIAGVAVTATDCRKMAMATKCYLIAKAPRQQAINTITFTHTGVISEKGAADIFDALNEPSDVFYSFLNKTPSTPTTPRAAGKYCAICRKLYSSQQCPSCGN